MNKEIIFTDNAIKQINYLLDKKEKGSFFRIAIKGGGCSGFQYDFSFDKVKNEDDLVFNNFIPIIFSNLDRSLIGPLCFIRPSKVSKDKFKPSKSIYFFSINITILRVCKL